MSVCLGNETSILDCPMTQPADPQTCKYDYNSK